MIRRVNPGVCSDEVFTDFGSSKYPREIFTLIIDIIRYPDSIRQSDIDVRIKQECENMMFLKKLNKRSSQGRFSAASLSDKGDFHDILGVLRGMYWKMIRILYPFFWS